MSLYHKREKLAAPDFLTFSIVFPYRQKMTPETAFPGPFVLFRFQRLSARALASASAFATRGSGSAPVSSPSAATHRNSPKP